MSETSRYAFLVARDGEVAARAWCLDAARTYRRVVMEMRGPRPKYTMYRRQFIRAYLALKRFALARGQA